MAIGSPKTGKRGACRRKGSCEKEKRVVGKVARADQNRMAA